MCRWLLLPVHRTLRCFLGRLMVSSSPCGVRVLQMAMEMQGQFVQQLIERLRNECFERCIQSPGSALSSRDQSCLGNCVERYLEGMKVVESTISKASNQ